MFDDVDGRSYIEPIPIHLFDDESQVEHRPTTCQHSTYITVTPDLDERPNAHSQSSSSYSRRPTSEVHDTSPCSHILTKPNIFPSKILPGKP